MTDTKNQNIFPDGMFPQKRYQTPPEKDVEKSIYSPASSQNPAPAFHIPHKATAYRLSRKAHFPEESYQQLHIPHIPEEMSAMQIPSQNKSLSVEWNTPPVKKQVPVASADFINTPNIAKKEDAKKSALILAERMEARKIPQETQKQDAISIPVLKKQDSVLKTEVLKILTFQKKTDISEKSISISVAQISRKAEKSSAIPQQIPQREKVLHSRSIPVSAGEKSVSMPVDVQQIKRETVESIIQNARDHFKSLSQAKSYASRNPSAIQTEIPKERKRASFFSRFDFWKKKKEKKVKKSGIVSEVIKFGATTAAIFTISFVVMNASAISELISAKIDPVSAVKKQIALENVVNKNNYAPILPTAGMQREYHASFPSLDIKIGPLENRVVIPKIGKNVPVVDVPADALQKGDWNQLESDIQNGLQEGVVHYPGTAQPGQIGNVFITGHSSYYLWDPGKFKDVFVRLHDLDVGDEFTIFWNQDAYHYRIRERKVVSPEETSVLKQPRNERIATLMTCTPVGTAKDRLVLVAEQI